MDKEKKLGSVVAVTGASAGLGRAIALRFAKSGYKVGLIARDPERLEMINDLLPALPLAAHLRDEHEVWRELRLKRFSGHKAGNL